MDQFTITKIHLEWVQQCTGGCLNASSVGSFCADVVDYTFCSCKPVPATDGQENGVVPVCGSGSNHSEISY